GTIAGGIRAMITGLRGATIWSEDLNNLLPFYRDVLGLPVGVQTPGFVVLGTREGPVLALGTHSQVHGRNADPARHMVGLTTDDITAAEGRGNPDGNLVQLLQFDRASRPELRDQGGRHGCESRESGQAVRAEGPGSDQGLRRTERCRLEEADVGRE